MILDRMPGYDRYKSVFKYTLRMYKIYLDEYVNKKNLNKLF